MPKKKPSPARRDQTLSRDRIIQAAIELLDARGESGLTFRALSRRLASGPGAIYWHVADKDDLLTAACDAIVVVAVESAGSSASPADTIRAIGVGLFDAMDLHPWVGSALARSAEMLPLVRIIDRLGRHVRAMGVAEAAEWTTVSALFHYILGVGGQNAANARLARTRGSDRTESLRALSDAWSQLGAEQFPFARRIAGTMRTHDDRVDFLTGLDLILSGIVAQRAD